MSQLIPTTHRLIGGIPPIGTDTFNLLTINLANESETIRIDGPVTRAKVFVQADIFLLAVNVGEVFVEGSVDGETWGTLVTLTTPASSPAFNYHVTGEVPPMPYYRFRQKDYGADQMIATIHVIA